LRRSRECDRWRLGLRGRGHTSQSYNFRLASSHALEMRFGLPFSFFCNGPTGQRNISRIICIFYHFSHLPPKFLTFTTYHRLKFLQMFHLCLEIFNKRTICFEP
jgi:hypothetical protein